MALITEGAYPYRTGGAADWCHQLVTGSGPDRYGYQLVALTGGADRPALAYPLPPAVTGVTAVPVWGTPVSAAGRLARRRLQRAATSAAVLLCRSICSGDPDRDTAAGPTHAGMFREALVRLAQLAAGGVHPLAGTPLADVLMDAWRASLVTPGAPYPRLSVGDAEAAATLLEHALRPLAVPAPPVDACHVTSGGLPLLVALAAKWRAGIPYLLTEQGIYLRERYLDYGEAPEAVKAVALRFFGALSRLGYAEATTVVAASRFNQRWQLRHGAHPAKVVVVPGGADPARFPVRPEEPATRTVVWVGQVDAGADLLTLIRAFRLVRTELPDARLRLVGPVADQDYERRCRSLVERLGLAEAVRFTGPADPPAEAYAAAAVVVRSSVHEGMSYPLVEAMMTGRATVSADVGGVTELVGETGVLVPPGDSTAFAGAVAGLLRDSGRRRALAEAAAVRARNHFTADRMVRAYDHLYADLTDRAATGPDGDDDRPGGDGDRPGGDGDRPGGGEARQAGSGSGQAGPEGGQAGPEGGQAGDDAPARSRACGASSDMS